MPDDSLASIRAVLAQLQTVVDRFSSLPLEFEARGLEGDVPVPSAVFLEAIARLSQLAVMLASTQVSLSQAMVEALVRGDAMREESAARLQRVGLAVDQQGEQIHAHARTHHQLTTLLARSEGRVAAEGVPREPGPGP
jgi:hypothetical protein